MKKTILFLLGILFGETQMKAQLAVDAIGKVTIGQNTTNKITFNPTINTPTLLLTRSNTCTGGASIQISPNSSAQGSDMSGIVAYTSPSTSSCYGVGGIYFHYAPTPQNGATGVFGASYAVAQMLHSGVYAGYFRGDVRVTGTLYGTLVTPSSSAGASNSTATIVGAYGTRGDGFDEEGVSDKLQQVQLLQFYRSPDENKFSEKEILAQKAFMEEHGIKNMPENEEIPQTKLSTIRYGLDTEQLKGVYPELVYEDANGNVSINYIEMIPLLVQAVNEVKAENETLKDEIAELKGGKDTKAKVWAGGTSIDTPDEAILSLSQNNPNPFSSSTSIAVSVPESIKSATLFVYNMSGKQIKRIDITDRGASRINITSEGLGEGMYLYSLIADGKVVGTKKMIRVK